MRTFLSPTRLLLNFAVLLMAFFILGPILWLAAHAFVSGWQYPNLYPSGFTLSWWSKVFVDSALKTAIKNSLILSPLVVLLSMVICLPAAYAAGRMNYWGRKIFMIGIFSANSFPKIGLFAAIATLYYTLNLMGTFVGVMIIQLLGTIIYMTWIPAAMEAHLDAIMKKRLETLVPASLEFSGLSPFDWQCPGF